VKRDPALVIVGVALVAVIAVYAATIGRGLVNYDDPWLLADHSRIGVHAMFFDLGRDTRFALGAEYLPVRDLSIALDRAIWGSWYGGYHLTNVLIYLAAIAVWFAALVELGFDRKVVAIAILLWALHPAHAESVAWLSERKGLLGALWAGAAALGYARFRRGGRAWWLVLAAAAGVAAVWSKAPMAFALACLAGLELLAPAARVSWRRSLIGLFAIAVVAALAFVPVVITAMNLAVVTTAPAAPASTLAMAVGGHGFYVRSAALLVRPAASYAIATQGPGILDLVIGAIALAAAIAVLAIRRAPAEVRAGALIWLVCWFPVSRLVLPLRAVLIADRYLLVPTLGAMLALAAGLSRIPGGRARNALIAAIVLAAAMRTLDAESSWRDSATLWRRATESNPYDGDAWSMYAEALSDAGNDEAATVIVAKGLHYSKAPRLWLRAALLALDHSTHERGVMLMQRAAEGGEPRAMANLALLLLGDGHADDAIGWARKSVAAAPLYAGGHRARGKVALALGILDEAHAAFERALALEPENPVNKLDLGLVLVRLGKPDEARPLLEACLHDPKLAAQARSLLGAPR
jgi:tetratricopeptide (TPR) repeat protein